MSRESEYNELNSYIVRVEALNNLYANIKRFTKDGSGFTYGVDDQGQKDPIGQERLRVNFNQNCLIQLDDFHALFAKDFNIVLQVNFALKRMSLPKTDIPTLETIEQLITDLIVVPPNSFVNPPKSLTRSSRI